MKTVRDFSLDKTRKAVNFLRSKQTVNLYSDILNEYKYIDLSLQQAQRIQHIVTEIVEK